MRIAEAKFRVLAAAAFIEGVAPPDLLRPSVEACIAELESDPQVAKALQAKRERDEQKAADAEQPVSSLDDKRRHASRRDA